MNETTQRGLQVAGLSATLLFLALALIDYAAWDSEFMWPIFVGWAFLVVLLVILALASSGLRVVVQVDEPETATAPAAPSPAMAPAPSRPTVPAPAVKPAVPFTYEGYTLYSRMVELKNGGSRQIWFFSRRKPSSGAPAAKPAGFHVGVNERTGLPFLKRGAGADGEDLTPAQEHHLRPQCAALTEDGLQCRNSARAESKYCASHFGYQPPVISRAEVGRADTRARVRDAPDTKPAARKRSTA